MSLYRRHTLAPLGIALVAVALADRVAFFSGTGAVLILAGAAILGLAAIAPDPPGDAHVVYPVLLVALAVMTALTAELPAPRDLSVAALTVGGAVVFYVCTTIAPLRRYRLYLAGGLLIAAHAVIVLRVAVPPHQDVWRFLNFGVDALLKGQNPYAGNYIGADGEIFRLTYPPAALVLLAPFRVILGDIRWGYIACEAIVVVLLPRVLRRSGGSVARWQEALILVPLVLPRVSQAFFVFSNQEWLLLALAAGALVLALDSRWAWAGLLAGLGIASKQYFVVFPVLYLVPTLRRRALFVAVAVGAAVTLPFVLWGPAAFVDHVFGNLSSAPDPDRLTVWAMLANGGQPSGRAVSAVLAIAGTVSALALAWAGRRSLSTSLMACGLGLFAFTLGATFAGYNYYVYGLVFITWGLLIPAAGDGDGRVDGRLIKSD
jgi:hypothetical protein